MHCLYHTRGGGYLWDRYSASLLHDLLLLSGITLLHDLLKQLEGCPRDQRQQRDLQTEGPIDIANLEVLSKEGNTANVEHHCEENGDGHLPSNARHL